MICPECHFDKWDGKSSHLYGGRESAKLTCFGPRRRDISTIPSKHLDSLDDARKAIHAKPVEIAEPKEIISEKKPNPKIAALSAAVAQLESSGLIQRGAALVGGRSSAPKKKASARRKRTS